MTKKADKWQEIGYGLGFNYSELDAIQRAPLLLLGGPSVYMDAMLSAWYEWAPGDARGSTSYATLDSLRKAVDKAGLGWTATELDKVKEKICQ